jgi:antitoxin HigA-1
MKMKNPRTPARSSATAWRSLIKDAADALGVTRQQLHKVISGRSGITPEMAVRLEKAIGSTADTWLRMQMDYDLAHIRRSALKVRSLVPA